MTRYERLTKRQLIDEVETLRASEQGLRALVESTKDVPFSLDIEGRITYMGPQAARYGIDPHDAVSKHVLDLVSPDDRERVAGDLQRTLTTGEEFPTELRITGADGSQYWLEEFGTALRDEAGEVTEIVGTLRDITERKRAEEALQTAQRHYADFINVSSDRITYWRMPAGVRIDLPIEEQLELAYQAVCVDANRAFWETFGFDSREEVIGKAYGELFRDRTYDDVIVAFIQNGYRLVDVETRGVTGSGADVTSLATWHGVVEDGVLTHLWTSSKNITELKESERRFRALFDQASEFSAVIDTDGMVETVNNAVRNALLESGASVIGKPFWEMPWWSSPALQALVRDSVSRAVDGETVRWESDDVDGEGNHRFVDALISPIRGEGGKVVRLLALGRDITELKLAENTLRKSEERYRTLVEHAPEAITVVDCDSGTFVDVNQRACELFQLAREELLKARPVDLSPPLQPNGRPSKEMSEDLLRQAVSGGAPQFEWIHLDATGREIPCEVSVVRLPSEAGTFVRGAITDITERKKAEESLRETEAQLVQAQKMEAIGRLAGGVAHDFNNLLTIINTYSQMATEEFHDGDPLKADMQMILDAGRKAASLTRQLLAFSRQQVLELRVLDLNGVAGDLAKMLSRLIGEDIELSVILADDLGRVTADPGQMDQVLVNLAVNARDAMPQGGQITIETRNVGLKEARALGLSDTGTEPYVSLAVTDTGTGIAPEALELIFEPFFTTKGEGVGTGLGLSTVFGIVTQSGGEVRVSSELGRGTTFKVYLPSTDAREERVQGKKDVHDVGGEETILVVEDNEVVRALTSRILTSAGYEVITARSGGDALVECERLGEGIELLLTDVVMPKMGGRELADRLTKTCSGLKVIFMTGYTDDTLLRGRILGEGTHLIIKPFEPGDLLRKVRLVLDGD